MARDLRGEQALLEKAGLAALRVQREQVARVLGDVATGWAVLKLLTHWHLARMDLALSRAPAPGLEHRGQAMGTLDGPAGFTGRAAFFQSLKRK